jgi:hypothetical protein
VGWRVKPCSRNWTTGAVGGPFAKAFHYFSMYRQGFLRHYHKRSNVETAVMMIKSKFGDAVRSKTELAMRNEVLCKQVLSLAEIAFDTCFQSDELLDDPKRPVSGLRPIFSLKSPQSKCRYL